MNRAELEQAIWHALHNVRADRHPYARNTVDNLLDAADAYGRQLEDRRAAARLLAMSRDLPDVQAERRAVLKEAVS